MWWGGGVSDQFCINLNVVFYLNNDMTFFFSFFGMVEIIIQSLGHLKLHVIDGWRVLKMDCDNLNVLIFEMCR